MQKILLPFDGSENALRAVRYAVSLAKQLAVQIKLLHMQDPVPIKVHAGSSDKKIRHRQTDKSERILQPARQLLNAEELPYQVRCRPGSPVNEIALHAHEL